jgi:G3E family GTPase
MAAQVPHPLGFTVIGGYLGAGKTTLVNRLLAEPGGRRLGVVVNDFGSVNIDAALITSHDGATVNLANGCVCCSLGTSLLETLDELRAHRPALDHVVVEVSGVGDPRKTAQWGHTPGFELQGVLVLVDVETLHERLADTRIADVVAAQIAGADLVMPTKADLVDAETLAAAHDQIRGLTTAPFLPPLSTTDVLLGATTAGEQLPPGLGGSAAPDPSTESGSDDGASHTVEQVTVSLVGSVDRDRLAGRLAEAPPGLLRLKGIARWGERRLVVQVVGRRIQIVADRAWERTDEAAVVALWVGEPSHAEMQRYLEGLAPNT